MSRITKADKESPVFKVFKSGNSGIFWCPFCCRFHYHCYESEGHRLAHCDTEYDLKEQPEREVSPFRKTGYILKHYSKSELRDIMKWCKEELSVR